MKNIKRLVGVVLALLALIVSSVVPAYAAQTGSLTINGTVEGQQYDLYRVFDLTQDGESYSYTINPDFTGYFAAKGINNYSDAVTYIHTLDTDSAKLSTEAQALLKYAVDKPIIPASSPVATSSSTVVSGLDYGYYLLNPRGGSIPSGTYATMFALNTLSGNDTVINVKAVYPTIDKTFLTGDPKTKSVSIGDDMTFQLTSKVPDMTGYNHYYYVVQDTLSKGLTYKAISSIKIGATTLATDAYTVESITDTATGETALRIIFKNFLQYNDRTAQDVVITYVGTLADAAALGTPNKNTAKLQYSNDPKYDYLDNMDSMHPDDPNSDPNAMTGLTPVSTTETFTTSLTINLTDGTDLLTGAEFKISGENLNRVLTTGYVYELDPAGTYYKLNDGTYTTTAPDAATMDKYESDLKYRRDEQTTQTKEATAYVDANGQLVFAGLGEGTYTISEVTAPNGYNKVEDFTIVVEFDEKTQKYSATSVLGDYTITETNNLLTLDIVNTTGVVLPSTGGMGTKVIYIAGSALALGATILLVVKKRMKYNA